MELKNSKTFDHLARAFAGECMARTRYEFAEYGARKAGYDNIAAIIDEIAYQEFNHARMFYTALQSASDEPLPNIDICAGYPFSQRWDLTENLSASAEDEKAEGSEIYPEYARVAEEEGFKDIAGLFRNVAAVELRHERIFRRLLGDLKSGRLYEREEPVTWRCSACGYETESREAFEQCPLCQAKRGSIDLYPRL